MESKPDIPVAHVRQDENGNWLEPHHLDDHLRSVADIASQQASRFGAEDWARLVGLWHDLGKYRQPFQSYIRHKSGFESENAHIEQGPGRVTHSTAGASHALEKLGPGYGHILAYLIAGHHAGLPDWEGGVSGQGALRFRLANGEEEYNESLKANPPASILETPESPGLDSTVEACPALWMRLLFSCLVDADFIDTESYMDPGRSEHRTNAVSLDGLGKTFFAQMNDFRNGAPDTALNRIRNGIFDECMEAAELAPGMFSLTVPTGGGKTLSSMAFALRHAAVHGKKRIIHAIPFTSIIEQNARVYREIFQNPEAVLEHHSNLDPSAERENTRSRLATENWDAPLIVTTNVQLFESLFSSRTSRCRKLHNLVDSVIVLDEAQQLPRDFHGPITSVMQDLSDHFGVTWLLCTATQPVLGKQEDAFGRTEMRGVGTVREVVSDPAALSAQLRRVAVHMPADSTVRSSWDDLAAQMADEHCVLAIVNTRRHARALFDALPNDGNSIHLSANMCAEHRSAVIREIRQRLADYADGAGRPLRVVSTQLIEAGVDVDFPVVYRAMAGLDSIAQAAGRCNREDRLASKGQVRVFLPEESAPPGFLRQGEQATLALLQSGQLDDPLSPECITRYFRKLNRMGDRDTHGIEKLLTPQPLPYGAFAINFREAADKFRMIDNSGIGVIVPYCADGEAESPVEAWLTALENDPSTRWALRKLQRYTVTLPEQFVKKLQAHGAVYVRSGQYVVESSHYHPVWGVRPPMELMSAEEMMVT